MGIKKLLIKYTDVPLFIILMIIVSIIIKCQTSFMSFDMNPLYETFAIISATMIGFLITAFSILFTIPSEGKIEKLKEDNFFSDILYFFILAIISQFSLFIFCLFGIFLKTINPFQNILFLIFFLISLLFLVYVIWFLKKTVDVYSEEKDNDFLEE